jgi:hypothetical protein
MWGNDYPHDEGPYLYSGKMQEAIRASTSAEDARNMLGDNAARIDGFDVSKLALQLAAAMPAMPA